MVFMIRLRFLFGLTLLSTGLLLNACLHDSENSDPKTVDSTLNPASFWVLQLTPKLTVVYDTLNAAVRLAWRGEARLDSPLVQNGPLLHRMYTAKPWTLLLRKSLISSAPPDTEILSPHLLSHDAVVVGGVMLFRYELRRTQSGKPPINMKLRLLHDDHYGDHALFHDIELTGVPEGGTVKVQLGGDADLKPYPELWSSAGGGALIGERGNEAMLMDYDGFHEAKVTWVNSYFPPDSL